jgi:hypothetical protein
LYRLPVFSAPKTVWGGMGGGTKMGGGGMTSEARSAIAHLVEVEPAGAEPMRQINRRAIISL